MFAVLGEARRAVDLRLTSNPETVPGQKSYSRKLNLWHPEFGNIVAGANTPPMTKMADDANPEVRGELRSDRPLVRAWDWRDRRVAGKQHG